MSAYQYDPESDEGGSAAAHIAFGQHLRVLWRRRVLIMVATLLYGVVTLVLSAMTPRTYEATVRLIVSPPKTWAANEVAQVVSVGTFRALVENQTLGARMVEEFGLDRPPHNLAPSLFMSSHVTVQSIRDSNVILVKVRLWDPDLAAKVANRLAQAAGQLAQELNQQETVTTRDLIKTQLDQSKERLDRAQTRLENFKRKAQIELLRKDVDAMLNQRGALLALQVEIQAEQARLSQAESQLDKRNRIDILRRSIDTDPAAMEAARRGATGTGSVLALELKNEQVNQVYEGLDAVTAASRTKLAGLEKQRAELVDVRKLDRDEQAKLSLLYQYEMELSQLEMECDLAKKVYVDVATRYEQVRLLVPGQSAQIQTMDLALPPDRPISPAPIRETVKALALGLMAMVVGVLLFHALRQVLARTPEPQPPAGSEPA